MRKALVGAAVVAIIAVVGTTAVWVLKPAAPLTVSRFSMMLPESDVVLGTMNITAGGSSLALSPDGSTLVYAANRNGALQLFRRDMSSTESVPIPGTENATAPGYIGNGSGLMRVPAAGGAASPLTVLDEAAGETDHRFPVVLPGGNAVLFTVWSSPLVNAGIETAEIVAQVLSTGERRKIIPGAAARFATSGQQNDIWVWDIARETLVRLTFDEVLDRGPVWSPNSSRIAFGKLATDGAGVFWQSADGAGTVDRLSDVPDGFPDSFAPNGRLLLFHTGSPRNIGTISLDDGRSELLIQTPFDEANAEVSPDGRWLAYQSNESGRPEIYIRPFPDVNSGRWQVSTGGGGHPLWARNGRSLFYTTGPVDVDQNVTLMEVPIDANRGFVSGAARAVISGPNGYVAILGLGRSYDVTSDGQRFLMIKQGSPQTASDREIIVVQNWTEELKRLVPLN